MARELHDHFFRQAKRDGYLSRAAYKLLEIHEKRSLFRRGMRVLDCGAAPGSWCQVAGDLVGPGGRVVGVDLTPIHHQFRHRNVTTIVGDLRAFTLDDLTDTDAGTESFDAVLSDMAPKTTGERTIDHHGSIRLCELVLEQLPTWLRPGGPLVMKVFEGEAYASLLERTRSAFDTARGFKPRASRDESTEMYIVATGFLGETPVVDAGDDLPPGFERPNRRPSSGWG